MCYFQVKDYTAIKRNTHIQLDLKNILLNEKKQVSESYVTLQERVNMQTKTAILRKNCLHDLAYG